MTWLLNFYRCDRCERLWSDEWSCACDDECPYCGRPDLSPFDSEDLTEFVLQEGDQFIALRSPDNAEHDPKYQEVGRFPTRAKAEEFLVSYEAS
jgi:hypothetical protein